METSDDVPMDTIDLGSANATAELGKALSRTGFVQIQGHEIAADARRWYRNVCDDFFALSSTEKQRYVHPDFAANRGYRSWGSESLSYSLGEESPPDLFESFNAAPDPDDSCPHRLIQATPWPDDVVPGFSAAVAAMATEFEKLARRIDTMVAELTGWAELPERSGDGPDMLAAINYRPGPDGHEEVVEGQQRMGAHSDYTSFTVLDAEPVRGLQIVGPDGQWVDVVPDRDAVLVNVGDLLAIATNDHWPLSLIHISEPTRPY